MIKCDELSKEKSDDDQFMCYQNQGYEDEESCKPIQEKKPGDDQFTSYQNEGYEESESDVTKDGDKPQEGKPDDQPESIDVLLWKEVS